MKKQFAVIESCLLVPSSGGVFDISVGEQTLFSKHETGRFPEEGEVLRLFAAQLSGGEPASS